MFTDGHHFMLSDLSPASSYSLTVQPANAVGMGPASMIDINTMEDGECSNNKFISDFKYFLENTAKNEFYCTQCSEYPIPWLFQLIRTSLSCDFNFSTLISLEIYIFRNYLNSKLV